MELGDLHAAFERLQRSCRDAIESANEYSRSSGARSIPTAGVDRLPAELIAQIARRAVQLYAETHPRPTQVTQLQAAEMLGLSRHTVSKMVKAGTFRLNRCGLIPIEQIDRALQPV